MKLVLAGYRNWTQKIFKEIKDYASDKFVSVKIVSTPEELNSIEDSIILGAGWSWIIPDSVIEENRVIALMHPSDLPEYAGGSPIQHQIIDGIIKSKATLFKVEKSLDTGPVFFKRDISLEGDLEEVLKNIADATKLLMIDFIDSYPDIKETPQSLNKKGVRKRLKPEDSKLRKKDFQLLETQALYNLIRCRQDPYPNVYIEDKQGRLYFLKVRFEKNE